MTFLFSGIHIAQISSSDISTMVTNLLTQSAITLRTIVIGIAANAVIRIGSSCKTTTK